MGEETTAVAEPKPEATTQEAVQMVPLAEAKKLFEAELAKLRHSLETKHGKELATVKRERDDLKKAVEMTDEQWAAMTDRSTLLAEADEIIAKEHGLPDAELLRPYGTVAEKREAAARIKETVTGLSQQFKEQLAAAATKPAPERDKLAPIGLGGAVPLAPSAQTLMQIDTRRLPPKERMEIAAQKRKALGL